MKLLIKQKDKSTIIETEEIIFCQSSNYYTVIYFTNKKKLTLTKCLCQFEKELDNSFIRISQSNIVNIDCIAEIRNKERYIITIDSSKLNYTIKYSDLCSAIENWFNGRKNQEERNPLVVKFDTKSILF